MALNIQPGQPGPRAGFTTKTGRVGLDTLPSVTRDEAVEHMIHHLQLAAVYFQAVPDDIGPVREEMERLMARDIPNYQDPGLLAARVWLSTIDCVYEEMKKKQGD